MRPGDRSWNNFDRRQNSRPGVLQALRTGHQGETKCILLARKLVFWPGIPKEIRDMVKDCEECNNHHASLQSLKSQFEFYSQTYQLDHGENLGLVVFNSKEINT